MRAVGLAPTLLALTSLAAGCGGSAKPVGQERLASEVLGAVPGWIRRERLPAAARPGARLFALSGCTACHTYLGTGTRNLGAPDLSAVGRRRHHVAELGRLIANPRRFGFFSMPRFAALGPARLHRLAVFLAASKGPR